MAVTYEQAREIVREGLEPGWPHGAFCLDDREIGENDEFYVFKVGAREYLIDGEHCRLRDIHQVRRLGGGSCAGVGHAPILPVPSRPVDN